MLKWFHVFVCSWVGYHYNHLMMSSLPGLERTMLSWHPAVFYLGVDKSPRIEFQYSAAYSVPWSPRHSSVNSFTMSFTLLLLTRSLHEVSEGAKQREMKYNVYVKHQAVNSLANKLGRIPEYLLREVVFLFNCDPWWREPWRLQRLL